MALTDIRNETLPTQSDQPNIQDEDSQEVVVLSRAELEHMFEEQRLAILTAQKHIAWGSFLKKFGICMSGAAVCITGLLAGGNAVLDRRTAGVTQDVRDLKDEAHRLAEFAESGELNQIADSARNIEGIATDIVEGLGMSEEEPCPDFSVVQPLGNTGLERVVRSEPVVCE